MGGGCRCGAAARLHLLLFLLLLGLGCSNGGRRWAQATLLPQQEVEALKGIATKLNKTDWDFSVDPCSASGNWVNSPTKFLISNVTCDCSFKNRTECHIVSLQLRRQNLSGVLPEEVMNLTYLRHIDLPRNFIQGPIPASWASLPVFNVSLQGNRISGRLPKELGRMPMLRSIVLEGNQIEGPIPPELGNIISLERFFISANNITGELPATFSRLTNMTDFRIDGTSISGKIPSFIKNWQRVNRIDMQGTLMTGPIPQEISLLRNLTELVTDLRGPSMKFPPLQNAVHLTELVLRNCSIYGEIPSYLGLMQYLKVLDISFNKLTGQIPINFGGMVALQYLYLTSNMLTGDLPDWMLKNRASNKKNMDISYNDLTGNPPSECQQANVNMVSSFSSSNDNSLQPCLRKNLPCMGKPHDSSLFINCGGKSVVVDGITYKDDSSQIGTSTFVLSNDRKWAYSSTGDFVGNENADYIARNTSELTLVHPELYTEARVSSLSLKYYGLCMDNGEYMVKLHFSEIVFTEDHTYSSTGKRVFDVFIQGAKVLGDFNIQDEAGGVHRAITKYFSTNITDNTLEIHFYWGGKGTTAIPYRGIYGPLISAISVTQTRRNHHGVSTGVLIAIIAAACLAVILLLIACYFKISPRKNVAGRQFFNRGSITSELQTRAQYFFTLKEIEYATKHFDPANKIGEGGFGPVYKGTLADGTTIAVKKLSSKSSQGNREFLNEIGIIFTLRHPNLVRLFGCCIDGDQLLLIYEFLENNSVGRALFGHHLKLDWPTRYNICIGTAKGLVYLHEESTLKIIHRDIKPSNILLDEKLQPKISDFGLAKLNDDRGPVSTRIAGTVGYMAPEYATRGCLTRKADIYSYGVVTLEIVSGMSNTNSMSNEEYLHLLDWAERLKQQGKLLEMVDRRLGSDYSQEQALRLLNVALLCANTLPTQRPKMSSVVKMLCGQIPVEIIPDDDDLIEDLQVNMTESRCSVNDSQTDRSQSQMPSNDCSVLLHNNKDGTWSKNSKDSGYLPSSSSSSVKLCSAENICTP